MFRPLRLSVVLVLGTLVACTFSVAPLKHSSDDYTPHVKADASCRPYRPPAEEPVPEVPNFTRADYANDHRFKEKLTDYAGSLKDYIDHEHAKERRAYARYQRDCNDAP